MRPLLRRSMRYKLIRPQYLKYLFDPRMSDVGNAVCTAFEQRQARPIIKKRKKDQKEILNELLMSLGDAAECVDGDVIDFSSTNGSFMASRADAVINFQSLSVLEVAYFRKPCITIMKPFEELDRQRVDTHGIFSHQLRGKAPGSLANFDGVNQCFEPREFIELVQSSPDQIWSQVREEAVETYLNTYFPPSRLGAFF